MHILVTADTLGGVWTYTRELVTGLVRSGQQVTLVSFGDIPTAAQTQWMEELPTLDYRPTAFKLEWMLDSEADMEDSSQYLEAVIQEERSHRSDRKQQRPERCSQWDFARVSQSSIALQRKHADGDEPHKYSEACEYEKEIQDQTQSVRDPIAARSKSEAIEQN